MKKAKDNKWIKLRHTFVTLFALPFLYPYTVLQYNIKIERFRDKTPRQYLILLNHQTPFDQFFVALSFWRVIYYLATEDIFSNGFVSTLIRYLVAPIPIKKQTTDITALKNCIRIVKEGGSIALAPEGNRTYSGRTEYMNPSIVSLVRKLGLPVALYRIEGGYGAQPRWSDVVRRGKMRAYVSQVIEPEEFKEMTNEELFEKISTGLYVNEASVSGQYLHKKSAEYLERAIYVCPYCGLAKFKSHGNMMHCTKCGRQIRYLPSKELKGEGFALPFRFVADWYDYQCDFVNRLDTTQHTEKPLFEDVASVSEVILYKRKQPLLKDAAMALYGDKVVVEGLGTLSFDQTDAVVVLGRNKLNIYHNGKVYQFKGSKRFNALKYVNIYHRNKNICGGDFDGKFLGL